MSGNAFEAPPGGSIDDPNALHHGMSGAAACAKGEATTDWLLRQVASELNILPTLQRTGLHRLYFSRRLCYNYFKLSKAVAASLYYLSLACM